MTDIGDRDVKVVKAKEKGRAKAKGNNKRRKVMPVDEGDKYIRIRVRDPGDFVDNSFRTVTLSEDQGIHSVMGKLKSDPEGSMVIQNYMFEKDKGWTTEKAKRWVADHKEGKSMREEPMEIERMVMPQSELRVLDEANPKLVGYAAVFDELSEEFFGMREKIAKGAFSKSIKEDDVRMLWNHDPNYILARNKSGTLKIWEDNKGLAFEATPPDTQFAKDLIKSIKRGDVSQNSFGFVVKRHDYDEEKQVRTLREVKLYDISPVVFPAYPQTEIYVRNKFTEKKIVFDQLKDDKKEEFKKFFSVKGIYSISQPDPVAVIADNPADKDGEDKSKVIVVQPKIPLVDANRYNNTKNKIRRYISNG